MSTELGFTEASSSPISSAYAFSVCKASMSWSGMCSPIPFAKRTLGSATRLIGEIQTSQPGAPLVVGNPCRLTRLTSSTP